MTNISHQWEKFYVAVRILAFGTERIQTRLADALFSGIWVLSKGELEPLSPKIVKRINDLHDEIGKMNDPEGRGTLIVWAEQLSDDNAVKIAE